MNDERGGMPGCSAQAGRNMREVQISVLAHELGTPLQAVLGWLQVLQREHAPDVSERAIRAIERNARAMSQIVGDLSDRGRILSGKLRMTIKPVDVELLVSDAVTAIAPAANAREIELHTIVSRNLPCIEGDAGRLLQVLENLLTNAVKFTPPGGRVMVVADALVDSVRIAVSDTGCGLDPALLPNLFDRFLQAESPGTCDQGLGLGLALVKEFVERHGGTVHAHSEGRDRGSKFVVVLPFLCRPMNHVSSDGAPPGGSAA